MCLLIPHVGLLVVKMGRRHGEKRAGRAGGWEERQRLFNLFSFREGVWWARGLERPSEEERKKIKARTYKDGTRLWEEEGRKPARRAQ